MNAGHDPDDVLELGSRRSRLPGGWRPSLGAVMVAAAALAVGLVAGRAAGGSPRTAVTPRVTVTVTATPQPAPSGFSGIATPATAFSFTDSPALTQDLASCATQTGRELELGVQVSNQSASDAIVLRTARAVLPLGGLKPLAVLWGPCGSLQTTPGGAGTDVMLEPGETTWLTIIFKVQVACPAPLPVQFSVEFLEQGRSATAKLPGFPDLGGVPYTGCGRSSQAAFADTVTP
jgi:hypothetical protein